MLVKCTICRGMPVGQVYNLYRYTCLFAGKSSGSVMTSKRRAPNDLPGPAPRAQAARTGPRAPRVAIPEPANEPVPSAAPNPAGAALAAVAQPLLHMNRDMVTATPTYPDEVVVIDPAAVTLSRRESQRLGSSGEIPKFDFYSTSKVSVSEDDITALYIAAVKRSLGPFQAAQLDAALARNRAGFALNRASFGSAMNMYYAAFCGIAR